MSTFKRIGSFALALIMVCSLIYVGPIEAAATSVADTCPHCGVAMSEISWVEWTPVSAGSLTESGHYYLSADFEGVKSQLKVGVSGDTENVADVVLDLRGNLLKSPNTRAFAVYSGNALSIMDTVGGGEIQGCIVSKSQNGGTIRVDADATFSLYSGTIRDIATTAHLGNGGVIGCEKGTVNIHGGAVIGGTSPYGGSIWVKTGELNITGGTISGGDVANEAAVPAGGNIYLTNSNFSMTGGTVSGGQTDSEAKIPAGGNIYISNASGYTASITGGTIENGIAPNGNGGNVYLNLGSLEIGGTAKIIGGIANRAVSRNNGGGNIYVQTSAKLTISGGEILNGVCENSYGGNVFCRGTLTVTGGTISGGSAINGGNLFLNGYDGVRENVISGGTIKDGTATTGKLDRTTNDLGYDGANIYVNSASLTVSGGMISDNNGGNAIMAYSHGGTLSKEEPWGVVINLNITEGSDLANALSGKVHLVNDGELNAPFGEILYNEAGERVWNATAHTHAWVDHEAVAPSCNADGNIAYQTCSICGAAQTAGENPMPLGKGGWILAAAHTALEHHDAVEATCDQDGHEAFDYCSACEVFIYEDPMKLSYQDGVIPALGHAWTDVAAVAPTCHTDGNIAYQLCSNCGAAQTAGENPVPLSKFGWVLAAEHTALKQYEAVEPTCDMEGHEAYAYCEDCQVFVYDDPMKLTYQDGIILPLGHTWVDYEAVEPTCGFEGNIAYQQCSVCGAAQTAGENPMPLSKYGWVLPALEHAWVDIEAVEPTCDMEGNIAYQQCSNCGAAQTAGENPMPLGKFGWVLSPVGHTWTDVAAVAPTCNAEGNIAYQLCSVCGAAQTAGENPVPLAKYGWILAATGEHTFEHHDAIAATCDENGHEAFDYCTTCECFFYEDPLKMTYQAGVILATGHDFVNGICSVCYTVDPEYSPEDQPAEPFEVRFEFGANSSAAHVDGNDLGTSKTYTEGEYSLALTGMSKVYGPAYDATGNSCIKLGTSSKVGAFSFTVPEDVTEVVIYAAKYKANVTKVNVNGTEYTLTNASNDGKYDEIVVDTSTNKTVSLTTVSGGVRTMINAIVYKVAASSEVDTSSKLITNIGSLTFIVGEPQEFVFSTLANENAGVMVIGSSNFSDESAIEKLEYYEVSNGQWYELKGDFGPATGFPLTNATSKFRVTFAKDGAYTFTASMKSVETGEVLCSVEATAKVNDPDGKVLTIVEANAKGEAMAHNTYTETKYTVTGVIKDIYQTTYGNMHITDEEGNELTIYGLYSADGKTRFDKMDPQPAVGDTITVYGILGQYNGTAQIKNGNLMEHIIPHVHTWVEYEAVEPTCDTEGNIAYKLCSDCGEAWTLGENPMPLSRFGWVLGATGHDWVNVEAVAPTCHADGNIAYQLCNNCGAAQTWEEEPKPLSKFGWVLAAAHTALKEYEAVEPTCDMEGHEAYAYCEDCQVFVYDDPMKLSYQDGIILPLGHTWVDHEAVAPTCHADGNIAYQQCSVCGAAQTWEEEPKPLAKFGWVLAAAHTALKEYEAVEPTCDMEGHEAYAYCEDCQVFVYDDPMKLTYQDGIILPLGHTWVDHEAVAPTCETEGNIAYQQCSVCGAAQTWEEEPKPLSRFGWVLAPVHNIKHVEAKDPTFEAEGNVEYWYCEDCGYAWLDEGLTQVTNLKSVILPKLEADLKGDIDQNGQINNDDVVLLLWHTLFPDEYPLADEIEVDLNKDNSVNNEDVVLLLWHTLFPEEYPL